MGIDVPRRGLLVKQAAGLGALLLQGQIQVGQADVLDHAVLLARDKHTALALQIDMVEADVADHPGEGVRLALAAGGADEHRLALAPPARRAGNGVAVGIAAHGPGQVMDVYVLHHAAVPHPHADAPGAVLHHAVAEDHVADDAVGFRADLQRGIPGMQHTVRDGHVLAGAVAAGHGLGGLEDDGVIPRADDAVRDHHILAAVRIDAVVVGAPVVVEDHDVGNPHVPAARHVQRPEGRVLERHVLHHEVLHRLKEHHPGPEGRADLGALVEAVVLVQVEEHLVSLPVDDAQAGDGHVAGVLRPQEEAAVPAGVLVVILLTRREGGDVLLPQAGEQHRAGGQVQFHIALEHHRTAEEPPRRDQHPAAALRCSQIHRLLNCRGAVGHAVGHRAEIEDIVFCHGDMPPCQSDLLKPL